MKINSFLFCIVCAVVFGSFGLATGFAASIDDAYTPLLANGRYLYQAKFSQYGMTEIGQHGNAGFGRFEADPSLVNLSHSLRFSPLVGLEVETGYGHYFPRKYQRSTYDGPTSALDTVQEYSLEYFQDYLLKVRLRKGSYETFIRFQEKRQKSKADAVLLLDDTVSFDDIYSHYEDLQFGVRYVSQEHGAKQLIAPTGTC